MWQMVPRFDTIIIKAQLTDHIAAWTSSNDNQTAEANFFNILNNNMVKTWYM